MKRIISYVSIFTIAFLVCETNSQLKASPLFSENFEGGSLAQWTGKNGGADNGIIVNDPIRPGNQVLSFSSLANAGDIFGTEIVAPVGQPITISFEYLGLALPQSVSDNFGGFLGFSDELDGGADGLDSQWISRY